MAFSSGAQMKKIGTHQTLNLRLTGLCLVIGMFERHPNHSAGCMLYPPTYAFQGIVVAVCCLSNSKDNGLSISEELSGKLEQTTKEPEWRGNQYPPLYELALGVFPPPLESPVSL